MNARTFLRVALWSVLLTGTVALVHVRPVEAQSVAVRYQRLADREKAVRAAAATSVASLRTLARSYEAFTRAHYLNGYADNALWQAAGLYETAYARSKDANDREHAIRLLKWLGKEYPHGTLARQADQRLRTLVPVTEPRSAAALPSPSPAAAATTPPAAAVQAPAPPTTPSSPATQTVNPPSARAAGGSATTGAEPSRAAGGRASTPTPPSTAAVSPAEPVVTAVPLAPPPLPAVPAPAISVKEITYSPLPKGDRLILEFTAEAMYTTSRSANPDRVFIDLSNAGIQQPLADRAARISGTLVKGLTVTRAANGTARIALQLAGQPRYSTFPLYDPFRLVIDVESETAAAARNAAPAAARDVMLASAPSPLDAPRPDPLTRNVTPSATKSGNYTLARQLGLGVSRIVIDPGHGGHDPGASANGLTEAGLVLDVALRLEGILAAHEGTDVVLTRRSDVFVPLEERTAIANRESADMFVSIHANASPQKATSGVETFFLDFASNPHEQAVAARENATSAQNMRVLPELVKTIALNNKLQESRELAGVVQTSLVKRLRPKDAGAKDLGVKRAPFVVLIGAQMPSVLAEVSFLTNKAEATLLKQGAYRQRIAQALADAILKYQGTLKKVTGVASARNDR